MITAALENQRPVLRVPRPSSAGGGDQEYSKRLSGYRPNFPMDRDQFLFQTAVERC